MAKLLSTYEEKITAIELHKNIFYCVSFNVFLA